MGPREIHTSPNRLDADAKVEGSARYGADVTMPGMVYACGVCLKVAHARVEALETKACLSVPGVLGVYTAADLKGSRTFGMMTPDEPIFADQEIKFYGDVVALVVAETMQAAREGAILVYAKLTELPAVMTMDEALKAEITVADAYPDNICSRFHIQKGDPKQGFAESDVVLERVYETSRVEHAYLEPDVIWAIPLADGRLEIKGAMQHPFYTREVTAAALSLPLERVVVHPDMLGGSFGGKVEITAAMAARAGVAALALNRPVKYVLTREESIQQRHKRHGIRFYVRIGAKHDGTLHALEIQAYMDGRRYVSWTKPQKPTNYNTYHLSLGVCPCHIL